MEDLFKTIGEKIDKTIASVTEKIRSESKDALNTMEQFLDHISQFKVKKEKDGTSKENNNVDPSRP